MRLGFKQSLSHIIQMYLSGQLHFRAFSAYLNAAYERTVIILTKAMQSYSVKPLSQIVFNKPNCVTGFRFFLSYLSVYLFDSFPITAASTMLISIYLDYVDGEVARKYNQCSFFGEIFDWMADITGYVIVLYWWNQLIPELAPLLLILFCLETMTMVTDVVSKCAGFAPQLESDRWSTLMLKYTMNINKRGYSSVGIGYWNELLHFVCLLAGALYFKTDSSVWLLIFVANLPMSVSYVWMHYGYMINLMDRWNEETQSQGESFVKFIQE